MKSGWSLDWKACVIVLAGFLLRVYFSAVVGMTPEDSQMLALAKSLSWDPRQPILYGGPILVPVVPYLLKLADSLGGDQLLFLRIPWIAAGTLTLWVLYRLVQQALGRPQALIALFLLAVDQFHVTWTRVFDWYVPAFACEALTLWALWKGLTTPRHQVRWFLLVGLLLGIGYYVKQSLLLVAAGVGLYLLIFWLKGLGKVSAAALMAGAAAWGILLLPAGLWEAHHPTENLVVFLRITALERWSHVNLSPLGLYLGELFERLRPAGVEDYRQWHAYPVHWVAGAFYLAGGIWALFKRRRHPFIALMLSLFSTVSLFFLFIDDGPWMNLGHFYWPSFGLIPAIVLAADLLWTAFERSRGTRLLAGGLCAYLALHIVVSNPRGGWNYPVRPAQEWVTLFVEDGLEAMAQQRYSDAYGEFLWASALDPKNAALKEWIAQSHSLAHHQKIGRLR